MAGHSIRYPVERYEMTIEKTADVVFTFDAPTENVLPSGSIQGLVLPKRTPALVRLRFANGGELLFPDVNAKMAAAIMRAPSLTVLWCLLNDGSMRGAEVPAGLRFRV